MTDLKKEFSLASVANLADAPASREALGISDVDGQPLHEMDVVLFEMGQMQAKRKKNIPDAIQHVGLIVWDQTELCYRIAHLRPYGKFYYDADIVARDREASARGDYRMVIGQLKARVWRTKDGVNIGSVYPPRGELRCLGVTRIGAVTELATHERLAEMGCSDLNFPFARALVYECFVEEGTEQLTSWKDFEKWKGEPWRKSLK